MASNPPHASNPAQPLEELLSKLEKFAETLDPKERFLIRRVVDIGMDPLERVEVREGDGLFTDEEKAILAKLQEEPRPRPQEPQGPRRRLPLIKS